MQRLKQRLQSGEPVLGTFLKTPHYHVAEVMSRTPLDVLCLDAEHAPYNRSDLDANVLACHANQKPVLIRVADAENATLLNALDIGADGVVVPHVKSAGQLERITKACFYGDKGRGYAGSTRFAGYTTHTLPDNLEASKEAVVIAQIEDIDALESIDEIAGVEGCDCLFIGRMDLTVALGETDAKAARVVDAVEVILKSARRHGRSTGIFVADLDEIPHWRKLGVSLFLLSSDHSFMLSGATALRKQFDQKTIG